VASRVIHEPENLPMTLLHVNSSVGGNMESAKEISLITSADRAFLFLSNL
jgi:hypothetical protein